jgi:hypothetical protein
MEQHNLRAIRDSAVGKGVYDWLRSNQECPCQHKEHDRIHELYSEKAHKGRLKKYISADTDNKSSGAPRKTQVN